MNKMMTIFNFKEHPLVLKEVLFKRRNQPIQPLNNNKEACTIHKTENHLDQKA